MPAGASGRKIDPMEATKADVVAPAAGAGAGHVGGGGAKSKTSFPRLHRNR